MSTSSIRLFTDKPESSRMQQFRADLERSYRRPVDILDLHDLPAPDTTRRKQKETHLVQLKEQLVEVLCLIKTAENSGEQYPQQLIQLRADRDQYETRIEQIERSLKEGGVAA